MLKFSIPFRLRLSLTIVIGIGFMKTGAWLWLGIYGAIALVWSLWLRAPLRTLVQLLGAELIFLSLLVLPQGWERASFLLIRSLICLLIMNSFLLTLPPHSFGIALKGLPLRKFANRLKINTKRATLADSNNFNRSRINNSVLR